MRLRRTPIPLACALAALAYAPAAPAASKHLWATVNVCDTPTAPNQMGVRASMPGNGRAQRMWMRFSAQVWGGWAEKWFDVPNGRSPWVLAGSARYAYRQAGWTFEFAQPRPGLTWTLRGVVDVQWRARKAVSRQARRSSRKRRARWVVVRKRQLVTRSAVPGVDGGDPAGTSKALCLVS